MIHKDDRLYVAKSTIPGAGGGLFAARALKKKECIGPYLGEKVSREDAHAPGYSRAYVMLQGNKMVDARDPEGRLLTSDGELLDVHKWSDGDWERRNVRGVGWKGDANLTRFVNHSHARSKRNAKIGSKACGRTGFEATRDIAPGEEILTSYGKTYWEEAKPPNDDVCAKCGTGGLLVECDGKNCHRSYHLSCAHPRIPSVSSLPKGKWLCQVCRARKASRTRTTE